MGTKIEQLERQVEVLREALCDSGSESASRALYAADRIDDEPVEATDAEVVHRWAEVVPSQVDCDSRTMALLQRRRLEYHHSPFGHFVKLENNGVVASFRGDTSALAYASAAAWIRAQKEAGSA